MTGYSSPSEGTLPLEGITVVSIEHAIAAPLASRHLADLGARVIKVERPGSGDFARGYDTTVKGLSSHFIWANRSKESIALDLKHEGDKEVLAALIDRADVFMHNLAPGAVDRLGFGSDLLREKRPELITCEISGYGSSGPYRDKKAYDLLIQCEAGVVSLTGTPEQPCKVGIPVADISAAMYAYSSILAALVRRERTGEGASLEVSLMEALCEWVGFPLLYTKYGGSQPPRVGANHAAIAPYGPYATADDEEVFLGIQNAREWQVFCETILENASLADDPRFSEVESRVEHRAELDEIILEKTRRLTAEELVARLEQAGIANARLRDMHGLAEHPQLQARGRWTTIGSPVGDLEVLTAPVNFGPPPRLDPIPELGEHTEQIKAELGLIQS